STALVGHDHGRRATVAARPTCPGTSSPAVPPGGVVVRGDLSGRGCSVEAVWAANVLTVAAHDGRPDARYQLGPPGDILVLGDWDGDGRDTPALYRPATGDVFLFRGWARVGDPLVSDRAEATGIAHGRPSVEHHDGDGRDRVVVDHI